jgi:hypothetical protein
VIIVEMIPNPGPLDVNGFTGAIECGDELADD